MLNVLDFGASVDKLALDNQLAFNKAIEKAVSDGGGIVHVPAGKYSVSSIQLFSNIELNLAPGAILEFSDNQEDYPVIEARWEGATSKIYQSLIYAKDAVNIAVTGKGILRGNGSKWWHLFRNEREQLLYPRPTTIGFDNCHDVVVRDIAIYDSPSWTVHPLLCDNVNIDNIRIENPWDSPNTDGINPESSRNIRISNCYINVGDDCIALKAGTEGTEERIPCENITITNCNMIHGHGGVVIGSEMSGDVRNVTISNCVFNQTDRGIRFKSRRGRGGTIENINISNIIMDKVMCPIVMNLFYFCGPGGKDKYVWDKNFYPFDERTPAIQNVTISQVRAVDATASAIFMYGLPESKITNIRFNEVEITMADNAQADRPAMMTGIEAMSQRGILMGNTEGITFNSVNLHNVDGVALEIFDENDYQVANSSFTKV